MPAVHPTAWVAKDRVAEALQGPCARVLRIVADRPDRIAARLAEQDRIALELLTKAAESGADCPSNYELAWACGVATSDQARVIVNRLQERGLIAARYRGPRRVVTIVATGQTTRVVSGVLA